MCGFDPTGPVPLTYLHVLAMPLHLKIFAQDAFPLRVQHGIPAQEVNSEDAVDLAGDRSGVGQESDPRVIPCFVTNTYLGDLANREES